VSRGRGRKLRGKGGGRKEREVGEDKAGEEERKECGVHRGQG
jgi:hypothetical protein